MQLLQDIGFAVLGKALGRVLANWREQPVSTFGTVLRYNDQRFVHELTKCVQQCPRWQMGICANTFRVIETASAANDGNARE